MLQSNKKSNEGNKDLNIGGYFTHGAIEKLVMWVLVIKYIFSMVVWVLIMKYIHSPIVCVFKKDEYERHYSCILTSPKHFRLK